LKWCSMNILNKSPFSAGVLSGQKEYPEYSLTVIVKGSLSLQVEGVAILSDSISPLSGDMYLDGDKAQGLYYPNDFVHFKPKADINVIANAYAYGESEMAQVGFKIGDCSKQLEVIGERVYDSVMLGVGSASKPSKFESVPIRYRLSVLDKNNPIGRDKSGSDTEQRILPQIYYSQKEQKKSAGFAPISEQWQLRSSRMGSYDKKWQQERWPWFPEDFDYAFYNSAPLDQQVDYLKGDETIELKNLHSEHRIYNTRLPGIKPRGIVKYKEKEDQELEFNLDSVWIDTENEKLELVWRAVTNTENEDFPDIDALWLFHEESLDSTKSDEEISLLFAPVEPHTAEFSGEKKQAETVESSNSEPREFDESDQEALDKLKQEMSNAGHDPKIIDDIAASDNPQLVIEAFFAANNIDLEQGRAMMKQAQEDTKALLKQEGMSEEEVEALFNPKQETETAQTQEEQGDSKDLKGKDFSNQDLSGQDFSSADVSDANFSGANLSNANLSQIRGQNGNFTGAIFNGAMLEGANLVECNFTSARFEPANLEKASFEQCAFTQASFIENKAAGAVFRNSNLDGAFIERSDFGSVDFTGSTMNNTKFAACNLKAACIEEVSSDNVDFSASDITNLKAGKGVNLSNAAFRNVKADQANFDQAQLLAANFEGASAKGSILTKVNLEGSILDLSDFTGSQMKGAVLRSASIQDANFTKAVMCRADLSNAKCNFSNFYEVDFLNATTSATDFSDSILSSTLLQG